MTCQLIRLEAQLRALSAERYAQLQLDSRLRHDMGNALMLVSAFRQLLQGSDAPDLLADAACAMERARDLVRPFRD